MNDDDWRPKLTSIDNVVVEGLLHYKRTAEPWGSFFVRVGQPIPFDGGYYCPLEVQGYFTGVRPVFGIEPIDTLMNAMVLVRQYFEHMNGRSTEPLPDMGVT